MAAVIGSAFGVAVCKHFNIDPRKVSSDIMLNTGPDQILSVTMTLPLGPDDLATIAAHMRGAQVLPR